MLFAELLRRAADESDISHYYIWSFGSGRTDRFVYAALTARKFKAMYNEMPAQRVLDGHFFVVLPEQGLAEMVT
jgi:hypothetical protein